MWNQTCIVYFNNDKKVSEYDQEIPQSQTNPRHSEEEPQNIYSNNNSDASTCLFLFKMIAKLESFFAFVTAMPLGGIFLV